MKLSTLLSASLTVIAMSCSALSMADDPRYQSGNMPSRGLFGMPVPQQWTGARPTSYMNGYARGNCPNGQCGTAACPNGNCATGNCPNGNCSAGACANGQCGTAACPNGQCGVGYGARSGSACPNGNCGINGTAGRAPRYPTAGASSDWAPRTTRNLADPYRRSGSLNDEAGWTQRSLRPVLDPVNDTLRSRYNREELDLNSEYFRGNNGFDRDNDRYRPSSRDWNGSSDRSMEAPAPSTRSSRI